MGEPGDIAFVLGGGGHWGAYEVGMLQALLEANIRPDLVVGTSVGAVNGAAIAAAPTLETVHELRELWTDLRVDEIFGGLMSNAAKILRRKTHLHDNAEMRRLLAARLPARFEDLAVPFECVAASIERAAEHWFSSGSLIDAILASTAVPGVLPPVEIGGEHFLDGGIVNSIPISRALERGATTIYVLHVGHIERPLRVPTNPIQVATVAFELGRRHRFARDLATVPAGVTVHVLPTGHDGAALGLADRSFRGFKAIDERIKQAHRATTTYLSA